MMCRMRAGIASFLFLASSALAQDFPVKPITLTVPFAAGGPVDTLARGLSASMTIELKQSM